MKNPDSGGDAWFYVLAALCGIGAGWADVAINDLLFTALLVLASCILLGTAAAAMAVAVGGNGGSVYSADGVGRVHDSYCEADAGADLWIVSGIFPRHRGSLWRLGDAGCGGQSEAGEVGTGYGLRASGFRLSASGFRLWLSAPGFWLQGNCRSSKFAGAVAGTPEARS